MHTMRKIGARHPKKGESGSTAVPDGKWHCLFVALTTALTFWVFACVTVKPKKKKKKKKKKKTQSKWLSARRKIYKRAMSE